MKIFFTYMIPILFVTSLMSILYSITIPMEKDKNKFRLKPVIVFIVSIALLILSFSILNFMLDNNVSSDNAQPIRANNVFQMIVNLAIGYNVVNLIVKYVTGRNNGEQVDKRTKIVSIIAIVILLVISLMLGLKTYNHPDIIDDSEDIYERSI